LAIVGTFARADGPHDITVNVDDGHSYQGNVGSGFLLVEKEATELTIELTTSEGTIESSSLVEGAKGADWDKVDGSETLWKCTGIGPNDKFWCVIRCTIKKPTTAMAQRTGQGKGQGGGEAEDPRWMSVSDVDFDADSDNDSPAAHRPPSRTQDEDYNEYPGALSDTPIGLVIPVDDDHEVNTTARDGGLTAMNYDQDTHVLDSVIEITPKKAGTWDVTPRGMRWYRQDGSNLAGSNRHLAIDDPNNTIPLRLKSTWNTPTGTRGAGADSIVSTYAIDGAKAGHTPEDKMNYIVLGCDIDVDSDNDDAIDSTNQNGTGEDFFEALPSTAPGYTVYPEFAYGMIVAINNGDADDDGNPDNGWNGTDWSGPNANAIENEDALRPGVLRGLSVSDSGVKASLELHNPVVRIKKLSGEGAVRLFAADEPKTLIGAFVNDGDAVDEFGGTKLWDRIHDSDMTFLVEGLRSGEVILACQLMLNGMLVHQDVVRINLVGVDIDIARLDGNTVPESKDHTQGSITKLVGPSNTLTDYALNISLFVRPPELLNEPGIQVRLRTIATNRSPGKVRIVKNGSAIWMNDTEGQKTLTAADLVSALTVQATYGGVVDLAIEVVRGGVVLCSDNVRVSGIPSAYPKSGRILFVNFGLPGAAAPYDDFLVNAADEISDALAIATAEDNIVVCREYVGTFAGGGLSSSQSDIVLAGLGGKIVAPPTPNPYPWTVDGIDWAQPLPRLTGAGASKILTWSNVSEVVVAGLVFQNALGVRGAALEFATSDHVDVLSCMFDGNTASKGGGGVRFNQTHYSHVDDCLFTNNSQSEANEIGGAGVLFQGCQTSRVTRCRFEGNSAKIGAGISLDFNANCTVLQSYFTDNHGKLGGGVSVTTNLLANLPGFNPGRSNILDCIFKGNKYDAPEPAHGGSGVFVQDAECRIANCMFKENAHKGNGGAIMCRGLNELVQGGLVDIDNCQFIDNKATATGGAIAVLGSTVNGLPNFCDPSGLLGGMGVEIDECQFFGNEAGTKGGALFVTGILSDVAVSGATTVFRNNTAGGGDAKETRGGAICGCALSGIYVSDATFDENRSDFNGGAVYHTTRGVAEYTDCTYTGNTAGGHGGALHATCGGDITLKDSRVGAQNQGNTGTHGGGISCSNAEIRMSGATVADSKVVYNVATNDGGGVYAIKPDDSEETWWVGYGCNLQNLKFDAANTSLSYNQSARGGAFFGERSEVHVTSFYTLDLDGCLLQGNSATSGINGTSSDGVYYRHASVSSATVNLNACGVYAHDSAAITLNGNSGSGSITNSRIEDNDVGLTTYNATIAVSATTFDKQTRGARKTHVHLDLQDSPWATFHHCDFKTNGTRFAINVKETDDAVKVTQSNFHGEPLFILGAVNIRGLRSTAVGCTIEIQSMGCYWGHASGPHDPSDDRVGVCGSGRVNVNPAGNGVTDGVNYGGFSATALTW
jgi:predicted outer membrane repeat protein